MKPSGRHLIPPLHFFFIRHWLHRVGVLDNDGAKRAPSAVFGIISILFVFILGKKISSWKLGLLASSLLAVSPYEIYFSQEMRPYTLLTLFVLISYYAFLLLHSGSGKRWASCLFGISLAGAIYTHYFGFIIIFAQGLYLLLHRSGSGPFRRWICGLFLAAVLAALYLPGHVVAQLQTPHPIWLWGKPLFPQLLESLFSLPAKILLGPGIGPLFYDLPRRQQLFWLFTATVWMAVWCRGLSRWLSEDRKRLGVFWLLITWIVVPVVFVLGLDLMRHSVVLSNARYFALVSPPLALLLAAGLLGLGRKSRPTFLLVLSLVMTLVLVRYYQDPVKLQDWKGLSRFLQTHASPRDLLVFNQVGRPNWLASLNALCLTYYRGTEGHPVYLTGETLTPKAKEVLQAQTRFWLIPQNRFFDEPGPPFKPVVQRTFKGIGTVILFAQESETAQE